MFSRNELYFKQDAVFYCALAEGKPFLPFCRLDCNLALSVSGLSASTLFVSMPAIARQTINVYYTSPLSDAFYALKSLIYPFNFSI